MECLFADEIPLENAEDPEAGDRRCLRIRIIRMARRRMDRMAAWEEEEEEREVDRDRRLE